MTTTTMTERERAAFVLRDIANRLESAGDDCRVRAKLEITESVALTRQRILEAEERSWQARDDQPRVTTVRLDV